MNDAHVLLKMARNHLNITWEDSIGDEKLLSSLQRGMHYLDKIAGRNLNYEAFELAQTLLLTYCRYDRSDAMHEFQKDYLHELLALQFEGENDDNANIETEL